MWSEQFPFASTKEIESFCDLHIPADCKTEYSWLIEQSSEWFMWRQENLQRELLQETVGIQLAS